MANYEPRAEHRFWIMQQTTRSLNKLRTRKITRRARRNSRSMIEGKEKQARVETPNSVTRFSLEAKPKATAKVVGRLKRLDPRRAQKRKIPGAMMDRLSSAIIVVVVSIFSDMARI
eukprot:9193400-Pyramimonas_sp.AAC.1